MVTALVGAVEPTLGDQLRDDAVRQVLSHVAPADTWRRAAIAAIADLAKGGCVFEAYDVIVHGDCGEPDHPSRWGAVFNLCAKAELIELAGYGPSSRPTVKSSAVRFWRGAA
jgi:hypothetical protein